MRKDYGKGVAYAEVDGRDVIYIVSPAFFLTALDAKTGRPLEGATVGLYDPATGLPGFAVLTDNGDGTFGPPALVPGTGGLVLEAPSVVATTRSSASSGPRAQAIASAPSFRVATAG